MMTVSKGAEHCEQMALAASHLLIVTAMDESHHPHLLCLYLTTPLRPVDSNAAM